MRRVTLSSLLLGLTCLEAAGVLAPHAGVTAKSNNEYDAGDGVGNCRSNPMNPDCTCIDESGGTSPSPLCTGNHCVKLGGDELKTFMNETGQTFADQASNEVARYWCVCLHMYTYNYSGKKDPSQSAACGRQNIEQCAKEGPAAKSTPAKEGKGYSMLRPEPAA